MGQNWGNHVARFRGALQWKQTDICLTLEIDCHPSRELLLSSGWVIEWQGCAVCISNLHACPVLVAILTTSTHSPNIWALAWIDIQLRVESGVLFCLWAQGGASPKVVAFTLGPQDAWPTSPLPDNLAKSNGPPWGPKILFVLVCVGRQSEPQKTCQFRLAFKRFMWSSSSC